MVVVTQPSKMGPIKKDPAYFRATECKEQVCDDNRSNHRHVFDTFAIA